MQVAAGTAPDGTPTVAVTEFSHPQLDNAGTPQGADEVSDPGDPNAPPPADNTKKGLALKKTKFDISQIEKDFMRNLKLYQKPIMIGGGTLIVAEFLPKKMKKYKGIVYGIGLFGVIVTAINK